MIGTYEAPSDRTQRLTQYLSNKMNLVSIAIEGKTMDGVSVLSESGKEKITFSIPMKESHDLVNTIELSLPTSFGD